MTIFHQGLWLGEILNLNLSCLLVIRQIDNHSPGGVTGGKLVPSSHERWEFRHTIIWHFSRGNQGIREVIPVPDGLGKETYIWYASKLTVGIWNAMECWFLQRLVLGTRSPVGILALPFRPLYSNMSRLSFLLFLRLSHLSCLRMPVILPSGLLSGVIPSYKPSCTVLHLF